jgi:hypothetical protein
MIANILAKNSQLVLCSGGIKAVYGRYPNSKADMRQSGIAIAR